MYLRHQLKIRNVYTSNLMECEDCGLCFFQDPSKWLSEAYQESINYSDTGIMGRNLVLSRITFSILFWLGRLSRPGLDFAGGYGVFVRLMRDLGISFYWSDLYTKNIFAIGFDESRLKESPGIVTAFEVLEHLAEPERYLSGLFEKTDLVFVSTELVPSPGVRPDWWYLGLHHGQHVQFHTAKSLKVLAQRLGAFVVSKGNLHLFSKRYVPLPFFFWMVWTSRVVWVLRRLFAKSLTVSDSELMSVSGTSK